MFISITGAFYRMVLFQQQIFVDGDDRKPSEVGNIIEDYLNTGAGEMLIPWKLITGMFGGKGK